MSKDIMDYFPFPEPRESQTRIIKEIEFAIDSEYPYILLEAGTGIGKSAIATTLAKSVENAYIFTMTKQLQKQYEIDFQFPTVMGRSNFDCMTLLGTVKDATCDKGACQGSNKFKCHYKKEGSCPYWLQKSIGVHAQTTLMNYDYALAEFNYSKSQFIPRELAIFDEAHNLEEKIMQFMGLELNYDSLDREVGYIVPDKMRNSRGRFKWLKELDHILAKHDIELEYLMDQYEQDSTQEQQSTLKKIKSVNYKISKIRGIISELENNHKEWIIDHKKGYNGTIINVTFKPLYAHAYAKKSLLKWGKHCLMMSATILNQRQFSKWLGIDYDDVYFIKEPSPFNPYRRPIILDIAGKLTSRFQHETLPLTIPILKRIFENHIDDKGLIHTNSYKFRDFIMSNFKGRVITHNSKDRAKVLREFKESDKPLVLVSPSMSEGVDLPYDNCRFQVIMKVPYPYRGDKQISTRASRDPLWYDYKTVLTLTQAYGRGMRAEDDRCTTYILDEKFNDLINPNKKIGQLLPNFLKEAIIKKQPTLMDF